MKINETTGADSASALTNGLERLLPCPFCGGPVKLEHVTTEYSREHGDRDFWGVVCRNTINLGGSCCMQQRPSASKEAAVARWNMRNGERSNAKVSRGETTPEESDAGQTSARPLG